MALGGTRILDQDLDLGGMRVHNPRAPLASDDLVRLQDLPVYADPLGTYLVASAAHAPANAVNLGVLPSGLVRSTVAGAVSTLSIDTSTYLTTTLAASTYQPILTPADTTITFPTSSTIKVDRLSNAFIATGTADAQLTGAFFLGSLSTGLVKVTTTTGALSSAVSNTDFAAPGAFYVVTQSGAAPANATNLGGFTSGVLQQAVGGSVSTLSALNVASNRIPFGAAGSTGQLTTDASFKVGVDGSGSPGTKSLFLGTNATPLYTSWAGLLNLESSTMASVFLRIGIYQNTNPAAVAGFVLTGDGGFGTAGFQVLQSSSLATPVSATYLVQQGFGGGGGAAPASLIFKRDGNGGVWNHTIVKGDGGWFWQNTPGSGAAISSTGEAGIRTQGNKLQYSENGGGWANFTDIGAGSAAFYVVTKSAGAPTNAVNLGALAGGVLQQTVSGSAATLATVPVGSTFIPTGAASGGGLAATADLAWDLTNGLHVGFRDDGSGSIDLAARQIGGGNQFSAYYKWSLDGSGLANFGLAYTPASLGDNSVMTINMGGVRSAESVRIRGQQFTNGRTPFVADTINADVILGGHANASSGTVPTNATNGFVFLPNVAGAPTGVPAPVGGLTGYPVNNRIPTIIDSLGLRSYAYVAGGWHYSTYDDGAALSAHVITTQADSALTNSTSLGALASGLVRSTVTTGVATLSIDTSTYLTTAVISASAGTGIGVSGSTGAVTFSNTGVTSIVAGSNVTITGATGAVTINATVGAGGITALTGDVTASGTGSVTASIAANAVTFAKFQTIADQTILGNNTGGTAVPLALTAAQTRAVLGLGSAALQATSAFEAPLTFSTGLARASNTITSNLSTGMSGGQTATGGTASGDNFTFSSTSHATKGKFIFGGTTGMQYNESTGGFSIGVNGGPYATTPWVFQSPSTNQNQVLIIVNPSTGAAAQVGFLLANAASLGTGSGGMTLNSTGFTTAGNSTAGTIVVEVASGTGNLIHRVRQASGDHIWEATTSNTERMRLTNAGVLSVVNLNSGGLVKAAASTGVLSLAAAGTDYQAALTLATGAVAYGASSTNTATDANNFFYDGANHRLVLGKAGAFTPAAGCPLTISSNGGNTDSWGTSISLDKASTDQGLTKSGGGELYLANKSATAGISFVTNGAIVAFFDSSGVLAAGSILPMASSSYHLGDSSHIYSGVYTDTVQKVTSITSLAGSNLAITADVDLSLTSSTGQIIMHGNVTFADAYTLSPPSSGPVAWFVFSHSGVQYKVPGYVP